ncbi:MAG: UDP-N-acetylmuramoyl-L-alanine--D-glutamate ligase [Erythrobacter sp.]
MITSAAFSGKRYAVLGLARSGAATVEALLASGAEVTAWDDREEARTPFSGRCELANPLEADLTGFASVVVSPGVPLNTHPIAPYAAKFDVPVIGDIELFAQARSELPPHKVVGITGTNGKSTTTALVHHILQTAGVPSLMGGNIGEPIMAQEPLPEGGVYVLELSSYQIDLTFSLDCDVAVLLNITPDHLDRYDGDFEKYAASKARLFEMQSGDSCAVARAEDWFFGQKAGLRANGKYLEVSDDIFFQSRDVPNAVTPDEQSRWPALKGPHNLENVEAALATGFVLELTANQIREGLRTFPGLPHRMERIAEIADVTFINDSKATNADSTAPAIAAYVPDPDPRVRWIVGGMAKEQGLGKLADLMDHVAAAYTIGRDGEMFAKAIEPSAPAHFCETLSKAFAQAHRDAQAGDVVLFSPAAASFDQFKDFEDRGQQFRDLVQALGEAA